MFPKARYLKLRSRALGFVVATLAAGAATGAFYTADRTENPAAWNMCAPSSDPISVLHGTVVSDAASLALPTRIKSSGPWLFVLDAAADSVLHIVDRATGAVLQSLGRRGRGPHEFNGAWSMASWRDGLWIFDMSLQRMTLVHPPGPNSVARLGPMIDLHTAGVVTGGLWLSDSVLIAPGIFSGVRLALFGASGQRLQGERRNLRTPWTQPPAWAGQARLALDSSGGKVVLANRYSEALEFFDLRGEEPRDARVPVPDAPTSTGDKVTYIDVTAGRDRIVSLFSGRTFALYGARAGFAACLHVFDWEGNFQRALELDTDVLALDLPVDEMALYAIRHDPSPAIVRFSLPDPFTVRPTATTAQ